MRPPTATSPEIPARRSARPPAMPSGTPPTTPDARRSRSRRSRRRCLADRDAGPCRCRPRRPARPCRPGVPLPLVSAGALAGARAGPRRLPGRACRFLRRQLRAPADTPDAAGAQPGRHDSAPGLVPGHPALDDGAGSGERAAPSSAPPIGAPARRRGAVGAASVPVGAARRARRAAARPSSCRRPCSST